MLKYCMILECCTFRKLFTKLVHQVMVSNSVYLNSFCRYVMSSFRFRGLRADGEKMSKSRGNVIKPDDVVRERCVSMVQTLSGEC